MRSVIGSMAANPLFRGTTIELRGILPGRFIPDNHPPTEIVWVFQNWLQYEVDHLAEERWPVLKVIYGHRRREVMDFLDNMPDWTKGILDTKMEV